MLQESPRNLFSVLYISDQTESGESGESGRFSVPILRTWGFLVSGDCAFWFVWRYILIYEFVLSFVSLLTVISSWNFAYFQCLLCSLCVPPPIARNPLISLTLETFSFFPLSMVSNVFHRSVLKQYPVATNGGGIYIHISDGKVILDGCSVSKYYPQRMHHFDWEALNQCSLECTILRCSFSQIRHPFFTFFLPSNVEICWPCS